jgi:hypothetical protein
MVENAKLDRLLTQVNCRITSIARLRDAGAISNRKAEQELKQAVELRAKFMRQIDRQNFACCSPNTLKRPVSAHSASSALSSWG